MLPDLPQVRSWHRRIPARAVPLEAATELYGNDPFVFVYESMEAHGGRGRYSFIGGKARAVFRAKYVGQVESSRPATAELELRIGDTTHRAEANPLEALRKLTRVQSDAPPVAPFCGGAVGYFGYDTVRLCERLPDENPDDLGVPDAYFLFPAEVIVFDHLEKTVHLLLHQPGGQEQRAREIEAVLLRCEEDERSVGTAHHPPDSPPRAEPLGAAHHAATIKSNMTEQQFKDCVERAKEYICAGDIFQVVLSQRFEFPVTTPPLELYKALRVTNPSPYMYYLNLDGLHVLGSSPEVLVQLTGRRAVTRPLAGTRRRGRTPQEDRALADELQADEKERAEHVMLVDLGRNDLGRVCEYGTVQLTELLEIERHSKVMHLVSNVEGWLRADRDAFDLFAATFPAGTVSGAPKVRAMEIIDELEPVRRGIYAGAIGYFSLLGDMDMCIAIRTIVVHGGRGYIQAGAGIVADSVPTLEYKETLNKAQALMNAVHLAGHGS